MSAAHLLAPLIQTVVVLLHESAAKTYHYKTCDLSTCRNDCKGFGALRWSCEEEGCLCTFKYKDVKIIVEGPDYDRGISVQKTNHGKNRGRNLPEHGGKKGQRYDQEVKLEEKTSSEQGDNDVDVNVEDKKQDDALGQGPMGRLAVEGDSKDKSKVKSKKKRKSELPFVVKGLHRSLSAKEVMDQIKKQKGAHSFEKVNEFIKTGG